MSRRLVVQDLGRRGYAEVLELQRTLCRRRMDGEIGEDLLLLVEHEPVVTLGRGSRPPSLPLPPAELERRGIGVFEVERGGDVTFHGPGQLVGYPILDLRDHREDLHWYLRHLEAALIEALGSLGIEAGRNAGLTGVWTRGRKIASIGVSGALWAYVYVGSWEPLAFNIDRSFQLLFMVIIGGLGSILGAFLGAAFILILPIFLDQVPHALGMPLSVEFVSLLVFVVTGALICWLLIVEPHGFARLWSTGKEKLRLWPCLIPIEGEISSGIQMAARKWSVRVGRKSQHAPSRARPRPEVRRKQ